MSKIATRARVGLAACVVTVAGVFGPATAANAAPVVAPPSAPAIHFSQPALSPVQFGNLGEDPWWFGAPNPNAPAGRTILAINPITLLPEVIRPLFGWFTRLNVEACVGGLSVKIGGYGRVSASVASTC